MEEANHASNQVDLSDYGIFVNAEDAPFLDFEQEERDAAKCDSDKQLKRNDFNATLSYGDMNGKYCGVECPSYANGYVVEYWETQYCGSR